MTEITAVGTVVDKLSLAGLNVLKAGVAYAAANRGTKEHSIALDEFCQMAGVGLLSVGEMGRLLGEGARVIVYVENFEAGQQNAAGSAAVFGEFHIIYDIVTFTVPEFIFFEDIMAVVMALKPSRPSRTQGIDGDSTADEVRSKRMIAAALPD